MSKTVSAADTARRIESLLREVHEERADAVRFDELRQLFARLVADGELAFGGTAPANSVAARWQAHLRKGHRSMVLQLCERIHRRTALRCMMGVVASSPVISGNGTYRYVNDDLLFRCFDALCRIEGDFDKPVRHMLEAEFLRPHRDVQYYTLGVVARIATAEYRRSVQAKKDKNSKVGNKRKQSRDEDHELQNVAAKLFEILLMIDVPKSEREMNRSRYLFPVAGSVEPDAKHLGNGDSDSDDSNDLGMHTDEEESEHSDDDDDENRNARRRPNKKRKTSSKTSGKRFAFQQLGSFQSEYQKAWIAIMRLPLRTADLKKALQYMPTEVLPNVPQPLRFSDFFMNAYTDYGTGVIGVLSLDGLFLLITKHGLEYADFYKQLYRLVTPRVMYAKYRVQFFRLLTKCLARNSMLPAHVVAAFCKRLCRCALNSPPPAVLFCLGLVSNLIRLHPECSCLINRKSVTEITDKFDADEEDPVQCQALQSSLWELCPLEKHYIPAIQTLARSVGTVEESKMPLHDMEDFTDHTYKSIFDHEKKKRVKTALTFQKPRGLFTSDDLFADILYTS